MAASTMSGTKNKAKADPQGQNDGQTGITQLPKIRQKLRYLATPFSCYCVWIYIYREQKLMWNNILKMADVFSCSLAKDILHWGFWRSSLLHVIGIHLEFNYNYNYNYGNCGIPWKSKDFFEKVWNTFIMKFEI